MLLDAVFLETFNDIYTTRPSTGTEAQPVWQEGV